jgi:hypothetical protein
MLRALESGTAGLHVPTGEVREFPTNTSDALTSGGTYAIAGAVERMVQHVRVHCGAEPACVMTGGAGWKMAPSMSVQFELVDSLIFDGLLEIAQRRWARMSRRGAMSACIAPWLRLRLQPIARQAVDSLEQRLAGLADDLALPGVGVGIESRQHLRADLPASAAGASGCWCSQCSARKACITSSTGTVPYSMAMPVYSACGHSW